MNQPNILIIMADQLRRDALSCYGDANIVTPSIDRLADEGVKCEAAVSTYPVCVPFRFTFMTGLHAHRRGVPGLGFRLDPAERTLADEFNEQGYHTVYVGKWHLDNCRPADPIPRDRQGRWSKWLGFELRNSHFDSWYFEDDDPEPKALGQYQTDGLFELAMQHLGQDRPMDQPFCCVLSVEPPHFPYEAPAELEQKWLGRELRLPPSFMAEPDYHVPKSRWPNDADEDRQKKLRQLAIYYAMIENLDRNVGRMLQFLDEQALAENTVVVFLSDHGETGGRHNLPTAMKDYPFEHSNGIPLIVRDPRQPERAGASIDTPICTEDLYPTLSGLAGFQPASLPDRKLDGLDVSPVIRGQQDEVNREGVLLEFVADRRAPTAFYNQVYRGLRTRRWKYTVLGPEHGPGKPWQLFDLASDPYEMANLVDDPNHAARAAEMHAKLAHRLREVDDGFAL